MVKRSTVWFGGAALAALLSLGAANAATPPPVSGGSTQVAAQAGCMNQWMFNGMWRVRVTNVAFRPPGDRPSAWEVTMQWANGTSFAGISPVDTRKEALVLGLANGDTLAATDSTTGSMNEQQLDFHTFPASGQFTYTQQFLSASTPLDADNKPAKLLITFDVPSYRAAHPGDSAKFWRQKAPSYNYRIDLTCTK